MTVSATPLAPKSTAASPKALDPSVLEVINDSHHHAGHRGDDGTGESHWTVKVESAAFVGLNRVARQRLVNQALADLLSSRIHALAIRARAPEKDMDPYKLWYWPTIQGRGEFVRLTLEGAGVPYVDCAREQGAAALMQDMKARHPFEPFAPPYLDTGKIVVAQVGHILTYLADAHDLAPKDEAKLFWTIQLQLTVTDFVAEVHNTHHPVALDDYYEDQKAEAARYADGFRDKRMPKYLGYFDRAATAFDGDFVAGEQWSPIDTSLFQIVEGLRYAFPKRMAAIECDYPGVIAVHDRVAELPGVAAYLASDRRIPFNEDGIFRRYPELDKS